MPGPARRVARRLAGRAIVAVLLALVALPLYLTISPTWRPTAVRLACATALVIGCARARGWARESVGADAVSPFEAPPPPGLGVQLDPGFLRLRDDLVASTRSRRYFDVVLWPRLTALAGPGPALPRPARRRLLSRRGPSLRVLEDLIARVERRP
ncbi:MAG TPA: hypothetical protein VID28_05410 [Methylomirabilota bacterium]|jgi:hypothetical protein